MRVVSGFVALFIFCVSFPQLTALGAEEHGATPFTPEYISENDSVNDFRVPEAYELANVLMVLSNWGKGPGKRNYFPDTAYYDDVMTAFQPYRGHPVFSAMNQINFNNFNDFVGFRDNAFAFWFEGDRLVRSTIFDSWWSAGGLPNHFAENLDLIEDFARVSGFREFYARHRDFYRQQIETLERDVDIVRITAWLEKNFSTRFNTTQVLFSPLIRGNHTASIKYGENFNALFTAVAGPEFARLRKDGTGNIYLMRQIFTEIDHGYVDQASVKNIDAIRASFSRPVIWYGNPGGFYDDPFRTFNEYMTWGAVLLYVHDVYPPDLYQLEKTHTTKYMETSRKFIAFGDFYAELEQLYLTSGKRLEDLYPEILAWAEAYQAD